ncbi:MAG: amidase [Gemmatimonadota bacterium]|nr:amidase [Gemmatimonadota bacterium]
MKRRGFLRTAAAATAATAVDPRRLAATGTSGPVNPTRTTIRQDRELVPLGNGEPPALQFQAYPGGTGALMEKLWSEHGGDPFRRHRIEIAPWAGPAPSDPTEIAFLPVHRQAALLRAGHLTPTRLLDIYLERMYRLDPLLLCAVSILEDRARDEAARAEAEIAAGEWRGPLHGIPYGLKDLFAVRGTRTTWGSADFENRVIDDDSEVAIRLRDAGAVLMAKLATGEFARGDQWYRGRTRNPWNPEEGSSGSSAGPGSATAAGCVSFGIGTETRGSIVSPARRNGLSALRPTFGRVSRHGGMVLSWSMDKIGPMCRTIEDCALVFDAIHGSDEKDPASLTAPFRFDRAPDLSAVRIGFADDAPETFLAGLRDLGANPRPIAGLPESPSSALGADSAAAFDFHIAPRGELPPIPGDASDDERRRMGRFRRGREELALDYVQSQRRRHLAMREMATAMEDFDMFVTGSGEVGLTNETGHPAVVVPYAFGPRDPDEPGSPAQPLTTTLVGALFADDLILSVAHAYQSATDWHTRHPDI